MSAKSSQSSPSAGPTQPPQASRSNRAVAVAGGTGFVGGAIARELASRGRHVVVLSHRRGLPERLSSPELAAKIEARPADVTRPESLQGALAGADALVIALAFRNYPVESRRRGQTFEAVDAAGTEALVAAARAAGVRRLVYVSGAGAAPDATKPWFRAKWRAEEAVRGSGIPATIFRPSWIYGPGDRSLNRFLGMARWLPFVPQIGSGRQLLAPVFVDDMAALVADSLEHPAGAVASAAGAKAAAVHDSAVTLEVGGPETLTMDDVIRTALRVSGRHRFILHSPAALVKLAATPLTILPNPPLSPSAVDFVVQSAPVDTTFLHERLPRRLRPLEEGLATYLAPRR